MAIPYHFICCLLLAGALGPGIHVKAQQSLVQPSNIISYPRFSEDWAVYEMTIDSSGYLWLASNQGLLRFNGTEYQHYGNDPLEPNALVGDPPQALCVTGNLLWVGTKNNGFQRYDLEADSFSAPITIDHGLQSNRIARIDAAGDTALWIYSHPEGIDLYNYKNGRIYNTRPADQFEDVNSRYSGSINTMIPHPDKPGKAWISTLDGIFLLDTETRKYIRHLPLTKEYAHDTSNLTGREMSVRYIVYNDGYLWGGTWGGGLIKVDPETGRFTNFLYEPREPVSGIRNNIRKLILWNDRLLFLSPHTGFGYFDINDEEFCFYKNADQSYMLNRLYTYCQSPAGDIWLANSSGLYLQRKEPLPFTKLRFDRLIEDSRVLDDGNWLILPRERPVHRYEPATGTMEELPYHNPLDDVRNFLFDLAPAGNTIYGFDLFGMHRFDQDLRPLQPYIRITDPAVNATFIYAFEDSEGQFWLPLKYNGMVRFDPENNTRRLFEEELVWPHWIRTVVEDNSGKVWYGSEKGLGYYNLQTEQFQNFPLQAFDEFSFRPEAIAGMSIDADGRIWCASSRRGIIVFNENGGRIEKVKELTSSDGLSHLVFTHMAKGPDDHIWLSHTGGMSRIDPNSYQVTNYGEWAGLESIYSFHFHNDTLIANGKDGVYIGHLPYLQDINAAPSPYMSSISLFGKTINNWEAHSHEFHHTENFLEIELSAFNSFYPSAIEYAYRLSTADAWSKATGNNFITFPHLPPEDYELWLRARYAGGPWSDPVRSATFTIKEPYWQTYWFIGLVTLIAGAIIFGIFRYRISMLKKKAELEKKVQDLEMKALRVQMNPHFMFNALNSVRYFILKEDRNKASDYLTHFSKLLRKILAASRENLITLEDELKSLELYLEFEKARFDNKFDYDLLIQEGVNTSGVKLQPLIVQPFVENAVWHGLMKKEGKGKLQISVYKNGSHLLISVEDNGIGRTAAEQQKAKAHKSFGMEITRQRLQLFKNRTNRDVGYEIEDLYENGQPTGTRVTIKLTAL